MNVSSHGEIGIRNGSATVFVTTKQGFGPTGTLVSMNAPLVHRVNLNPDLLRWVAVEGRSHDLGGVYVIPSGDHGTCELWLGHSFVSDELDRGSLLSALFQMLVLSDQLDDLIRDRFGGIRFHDRSEN